MIGHKSGDDIREYMMWYEGYEIRQTRHERIRHEREYDKREDTTRERIWQEKEYDKRKNMTRERRWHKREYDIREHGFKCHIPSIWQVVLMNACQ
jgi:hypothetical protein